MRRVAARGERHYRAKLTADEVRAIFTDPRSQSKIARDFKIDRGSISRIKNRRKWRNVTADLSRYPVAP
jgi:DNA invertase Pin-like site-specific DNA recombinase